MKVALVIGHHKLSKGAYSPYLKLSEWDFYNQVVALLKSCPDVYHHDPEIRGYTSRVQDTSNKLNAKNYDLVISLHFNSSGNVTAQGCETLYYNGSGNGRAYALAFSQKVVEWTGIKMRRGTGLKALRDGDRGYEMVARPKEPTILIEPFFGSNHRDCERIEDAEKMALIIDDFINNTTAL